MYSDVFRLHADLLKAMSQPKRLEVVHLLRNKELTVSRIQKMLDLPQANLSQHLQILRQAGVVKTRKNGKQIYYSLSHKNFIKSSDLLRIVLISRYKDSPMSDEFTAKMSDLVPLVTDPVCGMRISPKTAAFARKYAHEDYYFCASGCLEQFIINPEKFTKKEVHI